MQHATSGNKETGKRLVWCNTEAVHVCVSTYVQRKRTYSTQWYGTVRYTAPFFGSFSKTVKNYEPSVAENKNVKNQCLPTWRSCDSRDRKSYDHQRTNYVRLDSLKLPKTVTGPTRGLEKVEEILMDSHSSDCEAFAEWNLIGIKFFILWARR